MKADSSAAWWSGPEHGDAASTIRRWTGQVWSLAGLVGTSSGCRRTVAAALLGREEVVLHLLQAFGARIAIGVSAGHGDCLSLLLRLVDTLGDGLLGSVPELSRHERRQEGNAGHDRPVRRRGHAHKSREADGNHPGH